MRANKLSYGYKFEQGELLIDEENADIVRRIFSDRINGITGPKIGAALYEEGIPYFSDSEKKAADKVMMILRNERYFGKDDFPVIISEETFQKARDSMYSKVFGKPKPEHKIIKKMSFCAVCGKHMGHYYNGLCIAKWHCCTKGCSNFMPVITEDEYLSAICSILNSVIKNPRMMNIKPPLTEYVPNDKVKRYEDTINTMLSVEVIVEEKVLSEILSLASVQYDCCTYNLVPHITAKLKSDVKKYDVSEKANIELLQTVADKIIVDADRNISIIFKNGKKITHKENNSDEQ